MPDLGEAITIFLCGDVMTGRGVDQILPFPGDPALRESYLVDARQYVELAEAINGPIPAPVDFGWPWGDVLDALDEFRPDCRVINLETSITRSDDFWQAHQRRLRHASRSDTELLCGMLAADSGERGSHFGIHEDFIDVHGPD